MKYIARGLAICLAVAAITAGTVPALGLTAQEIADSVIAELDNVSDYTATLDVDYDDEGIDDMTDGSLQWKRNSGTWKTKKVDGTPYTRTGVCDGSVWNMTDSEDEDEGAWIVSKADGDMWLRYRSAGDLFNMENVLDSESWSKDEGTETVNSVSCYRLYTSKGDTNYEVWIDEATATKAIRVRVTDADDNLQWQLDYSDYSDVESTAQLPATIVAKWYEDESVELTVTYSFSDVDINEGLSDSIFDCEQLDD